MEVLNANDVEILADTDALDNLQDGEFKIVKIHSLNRKGDKHYTYHGVLCLHPELGEWLQGTWAYNVQNTNAPRFSAMRTPEGIDVPAEWVAVELDIRGRTANNGDHAEGHTLLHNVGKALEKKADLTLLDALQAEIEKTIDPLPLQVDKDCKAILGEFTNPAQCYGATKEAFTAHFADVVDDADKLDELFRTAWADAVEEAGGRDLDNMPMVWTVIAENYVMDAGDLAEMVLAARLDYIERQKKAAKTEAKTEAKAVAPKVRKGGKGKAKTAPKAKAKAKAKTAPAELASYYTAESFEAIKTALEDCIFEDFRKRCDDGVIRSVMLEGKAKGESFPEMVASLNARLANLG